MRSSLEVPKSGRSKKLKITTGTAKRKGTIGRSQSHRAEIPHGSEKGLEKDASSMNANSVGDAPDTSDMGRASDVLGSAAQQPTQVRHKPPIPTQSIAESVYLYGSMSMLDIRTCSKQRNTASARRVRKTIEEYGGNDQATAGVDSLLSLARPIGVALGSSATLRDYGQERFSCGLAELLNESGMRLVYHRFDKLADVEGNLLAFDLREAKRLLEPQLKQAFSGFVMTARLIESEPDVVVSIRVIGVQTAAEVETGLMLGHLRRAPRTRVVPATQTIDLDPTSANIEALSALVWEMTALENHGPFPKTDLAPEGMKLPKHVRRQEYAAFRTHAQLSLTKSWYGWGLLKKLVSSVSREVEARAASLDIVGRAPLKLEGVASFIAALPSGSDGKPGRLPVVRQFR
jgi:hypothetical protein